MSTLQVAVYAGVSSEQQAEDGTIASQIAALERRHPGRAGLHAAFRFVDDGYSGATLHRPALERLRDHAAGDSTASTSIRPIGWRAVTPTRSCSSMSSGGRASRWSSSTARSACPPEEICCCRSKA